MTIRLSVEQARELETVASVDDVPIVEVVRAAITEHLTSRRNDAAFQQHLRQHIEHAESMLKR